MFLTEPDEYLQKAADTLTDYVIELRTFMKNYPRTEINIADVGSDLDEELPAVEESQMWEKLTPEVKMNSQFLNTQYRNHRGDNIEV